MRKKKTFSNLDKYVLYCIIFFSLYTVIEMLVSSLTGVEHAALTEAVRWFCGGETFLCAVIKWLKLKKEE